MIDFCLSGSLADTKIVHRNQKCEVGLLECEQPKEECVPKSARSRSGVCMCVDGYTRSSSGLCTSMFEGRLYWEKNTLRLGEESEILFNFEHHWQTALQVCSKTDIKCSPLVPGPGIAQLLRTNFSRFSIFDTIFTIYFNFFHCFSSFSLYCIYFERSNKWLKLINKYKYFLCIRSSLYNVHYPVILISLYYPKIYVKKRFQCTVYLIYFMVSTVQENYNFLSW